MKNFTPLTLLTFLICMLFLACSPAAPAMEPPPSPVPASQSPQPSITPAIQSTAVEIFPTSVPTFTALPVGFFVKKLQPTSTPSWSRQQVGKVICPILLYHRIDTPAKKDPYYVTPDEFRAQLQALKDWGYTSITVTQLLEAINFGARLPERPVVITFDDGDISVYTKALPLMNEYGFTGVNYLVVNYVGKDGYMNSAQIKELAAAGWETGSHGMTHRDLTRIKNPEWEIAQSRRELNKLLDLPIKTFAYPFGQSNLGLQAQVRKYYRGGMGLGAPNLQTLSDLFYLNRRPVEMGCNQAEFGSFLPWNTPPTPGVP